MSPAPVPDRRALAERLATDPVLTVVARGFTLLMLPVLTWLFLQLWNGQAELRGLLHAIDTRLAIEERRSVETERRLDRVETRTGMPRTDTLPR